MPRISAVLKLSPRENDVVDRTIREHRYVGLDEIVADLEGQGIRISRTALWRYASRLKQSDSLFFAENEDTVVVIMSRSRGSVQTVKTSASADVVRSLIASLTYR